MFRALNSKVFSFNRVSQKWHLPKMRFYSSAPIDMAYNVYESPKTDKNATPLIIMHGLFGSKQNWRGISRGLESKLKRRVFAVDARNHGESVHTEKHSSSLMSADIAAFMRAQKIPKAHVIGHSMGGRTMMHFALQYPALVDKAIIVDISPITIPRDFSEMQVIFSAMKNTSVPSDLSISKGRALATLQLQNAGVDQGTIDFVLMNFKKRPTGEFYWVMNLDALENTVIVHSNFLEHIAHFPPYTGPIMFICGRQSNFMNPDSWPAILEIFPNAQMEWLDAGHLVHFDQPAKFIDLVVNFVNH